MLDHSLITSEVCLQCLRCCLFEEYDEDTEDLEGDFMPLFSFGGTTDYVQLKKIVMHGKTWLACENLTEKGCSIYKSRPDTCKIWDCYQAVNISRSKNLKTMPHIDVDTIKLIVDRVHKPKQELVA